MFREGRDVQENRRRYEVICHFSSFFPRFFVKNRYQIVEKTRTTSLCTKIGKESTFGTRFSTNESGSPRASRDVREPPRSLHVFHRFSVVSENRPGPASGRPQEGPGCPPGTSRAPFYVDFWWIFRVLFHSRTLGNAFIFARTFPQFSVISPNLFLRFQIGC